MMVFQKIKSALRPQGTRLKSPRKVDGLLPLAIMVFSAVLCLPIPVFPAGPPDSAAIKGLYQNGLYDEVVSFLGGSGAGDALQSLYLGLSYLRQGEQGKAIVAWRRYVALEKGSEGGRKISQYLGLLTREAAQQSARDSIAREKTLAVKLDPNAVAVAPFQSLGDEKYKPLSKGLAEMIITDLSQVKALKVVERIQIQAILRELKLSKSAWVDAKNAPRVGRLIGAGRMTTGNLTDLKGDTLRLDAAVTRTETGKTLVTPKASGALSDFYRIEKVLVHQLLCGLGYCPAGLDAATRKGLEKIHTKNLRAFELYSEGLDLFDQGLYREAARAFFLALEEDPEFALARKALLETPILPIDLDQIISGAEAIDKSSGPILLFRPVVVQAPKLGSPHPKTTPQIFQQAVSPGIQSSAGAQSVPVQVQINIP